MPWVEREKKLEQQENSMLLRVQHRSENGKVPPTAMVLKGERIVTLVVTNSNFLSDKN